MIIIIDDRRDVRLEDPLDNKGFHLEIRSGVVDLAGLAAAFAPYGELETREHAWVDTNEWRRWRGIALRHLQPLRRIWPVCLPGAYPAAIVE